MESSGRFFLLIVLGLAVALLLIGCSPSPQGDSKPIEWREDQAGGLSAQWGTLKANAKCGANEGFVEINFEGPLMECRSVPIGGIPPGRKEPRCKSVLLEKAMLLADARVDGREVLLHVPIPVTPGSPPLRIRVMGRELDVYDQGGTFSVEREVVLSFPAGALSNMTDKSLVISAEQFASFYKKKCVRAVPN